MNVKAKTNPLDALVLASKIHETEKFLKNLDGKSYSKNIEMYKEQLRRIAYVKKFGVMEACKDAISVFDAAAEFNRMQKSVIKGYLTLAAFYLEIKNKRKK